MRTTSIFATFVAVLSLARMISHHEGAIEMAAEAIVQG